MNKLSRLSIFSFYFSIVIVIILFFKLTSIYFENNPLNRSHSAKSKYTSMFPQGWAFFTKSSKDPQFHVFNCNSNQLELKNLRNFTSDYYFGGSRKNRMLSIEINNIFQQMMQDSIEKIIIKSSDITYVPREIAKHKYVYHKIYVKKGTAPNFKGKYLFVQQRMLPWSILNRESSYPSSYIIYPIEIYQK